MHRKFMSTFTRGVITWSLLLLITWSATAQASFFRPESGLWGNSARSGHGVDFQVVGGTMTAVWYTYLPDGTPIWYLAAGELNGPDWSAQLDSYTWDGTKATGVSAGTISMAFSDRQHGTLSWVLDGQSGSEPFELFVASTDIPSENHTGLWYDPGEPGWGLTLATQGPVEFSVLYFYDASGQPRWLLGDNNDSRGGSSYTMNAYTGFCPNCQATPVSATAAGALTRQFSGGSTATLSLDINLPSAFGGSWSRNSANIVLLSDPIPSRQLEAEAMIDETVGLIAGTVGGGALEDGTGVFNDVLASLGTSGSSGSCPVISSSSSDTSFSFDIDYGSGCATGTGTVMSGSLNLGISNINDGGSELVATLLVVADDLRRDGELVADGTASGELTVGGTNNLLLEASLTLDMVLEGNATLSGGADISANLSEDFSTGTVDIVLEKLTLGEQTTNGTIALNLVSATRTDASLDLSTERGNIDLDLRIDRPTESRTIVSTVSSGSLNGSSVTFSNLTLDTSVCESYPVAGTIDLTDANHSVRMAFDDNCAGGYSYEEL